MTTEMWGVLTPTPDGVTVRFERHYATTPEDLWSSVTEPERLARWLGPLYGDLVVGGRYELRMGDDVEGSHQNAAGEVLECDAPRRLVIGWEFPGEPDVVLMWLSPEQAMLYNEAGGSATWSAEMASNLFGRPTCAALPAAINQSRPTMSLGCIGMRTFTGAPADAMVGAVPASKIEEFARNDPYVINGLVTAWTVRQWNEVLADP